MFSNILRVSARHNPAEHSTNQQANPCKIRALCSRSVRITWRVFLGHDDQETPREVRLVHGCRPVSTKAKRAPSRI
jgi:hypothetical protein